MARKKGSETRGTSKLALEPRQHSVTQSREALYLFMGPCTGLIHQRLGILEASRDSLLDTIGGVSGDAFLSSFTGSKCRQRGSKKGGKNRVPAEWKSKLID